MFKATNSQNNEDVVILDPQWFNQIKRLRDLDRKDILVCPGCQQPVRVRAGQKRRWHFAHKHLQDCPLSHESPIVLEARAILYEWLVNKFKEDKVTLEKKLGNDSLSRPIDCWIEAQSGRFAYWIIASQIKPRQREELKQFFEQNEVQVNWVFLADMLREEEEGIGQVHLTTTEREFMHSSEYNEFIDRHGNLRTGSSLHYLDPNQKTLATFRTLELVHSPQLYRGRKQVHGIAEVLIHPKTGEFIHPGEYDYLQQTKQQREEIKRQREELERRRREMFERFSFSSYTPFAAETYRPRKYDSNVVTPKGDAQKGICVMCGEEKSEWGFIFDTGRRICKECYGE